QQRQSDARVASWRGILLACSLPASGTEEHIATASTSRCRDVALVGFGRCCARVEFDATRQGAGHHRPASDDLCGRHGWRRHRSLCAAGRSPHRPPYPGQPTVTVQLMPGAGGIRAANYLAGQAPRDGTVMTTFAGGPIREPLIGPRNPGYDMSSFTWIGAITKDIGLCISWGPTPFMSIDDVKKQQMIVAGTGAGSETDTWPIVLNDVLGTK